MRSRISTQSVARRPGKHESGESEIFALSRAGELARYNRLLATVYSDGKLFSANLLEYRQRNPEFAALSRIAGDDKITAVGLCNRPGKAQPESKSGLRAAWIAAEKTLEDVRLVSLGDADASIPHRC